MNSGLLQADSSFEYPIPGETECGSLENLPSFSGHHHHLPSFENGHESPTSTLFRSTGSRALNQPSVHPLSLHPANNFEYRNSSGHSHSDLPFPPSSSASMSTSTSSRGSSSTSPNSASSFTFLPQHTHYTLNNSASCNLSSHQNPPPSYQSTPNCAQAFLQQPLEARPRLTTTIPLSSGMPPPLRSHGLPNPVSPLGSTLRNDYSSSPSQLPRHVYPSYGNPFQISHSPQSPVSIISRSLGSTPGRGSPASTPHFFPTQMQLDPSPLAASGQSVPPFEPTKSFYSLVDERSSNVAFEIDAKIDKGFFRADQDWTCYRRNYFSVACSYRVTSQRSDTDHTRLSLIRPGNQRPEQILGFSMCIAAKCDGEDGKPIELVQHTPKRDKGPMTQPEKKELKPNPTGNLGVYSGGTTFGASQSVGTDYHHDVSYLGTIQDSQNIATFERIQFKKATANNGKRRAAQQYFHIVVELYAKVHRASSSSSSSDIEFLKIGHRVSAQMVVRGRSPGHYSDGRSSSANMGPGSGPSGDFGASQRDPTSAGSTLASHSSIGSSQYPRMSHGTYHTHPSSIAYSSTATSPATSSMSSSLNGSYNHFVESLTPPDLGLTSRPNIEENHAYQYYQQSGGFDNSSRPPTAPSSHPSTVSSPTTYDTPSSYMAMSPIKEEGFTKASPKSEDGQRPGASSIQLPMFGTWMSSHDNFHSPRDCRPVQLDTHRTYYHTMSAL